MFVSGNPPPADRSCWRTLVHPPSPPIKFQTKQGHFPFFFYTTCCRKCHVTRLVPCHVTLESHRWDLLRISLDTAASKVSKNELNGWITIGVPSFFFKTWIMRGPRTSGSDFGFSPIHFTLSFECTASMDDLWRLENNLKIWIITVHSKYHQPRWHLIEIKKKVPPVGLDTNTFRLKWIKILK